MRRCGNCGHSSDEHDAYGCSEVIGWGGETGNVKLCPCSHYAAATLLPRGRLVELRRE